MTRAQAVIFAICLAASMPRVPAQTAVPDGVAPAAPLTSPHENPEDGPKDNPEDSRETPTLAPEQTLDPTREYRSVESSPQRASFDGPDPQRRGAPDDEQAHETGEPRADGFWILGHELAAGDKRRLQWTAGQSFSGGALEVPVFVIRGREPGPTLCLTAAVHGDELNGVEIVRRVVSELDPEHLAGAVIAVPIVNLLGFTRGSRYLPDRRDLNRFFPGNPRGSAASRIAYLFFEQVITHCDRLVDFHTGSFKRTNMPQLRADLHVPEVLEFTRHFGATAVLHKPSRRGTLRTAATSIGIPAVAFELGQPASLQPEHVNFGVKAIETLLDSLTMIKKFRLWSEPQPFYFTSRWVRVDRGGILNTATRIGARIGVGDLLGHIINPLTSERHEIRSPVAGQILGMALDQFMLPGYAAFHIGIKAGTPEAAADETQEFMDDDPDEAPDDDSIGDEEVH